MKFLITTPALFLAMAISAQTQEASPPLVSGKTATVAIQSSAICDMCERTIEENLVYEKGVKKVDVDLATAAVHVTFDPRKTDAAELRSALTKLGYSADGTPADAAALAKLPLCCQKEGCGKLPANP